MLTRAVLFIGPLLLVPVYVSRLGEAEYGAWLIIMSLTGYLALLNLGIAQTVAVETAAAHVASDGAQLSRVLSTAWIAYWIAIGIAAVALCAGAVIAYVLGFRLPLDQLTAGAISATGFLLALPLQLFTVTLRSTQRVHEEQLIVTSVTIARYAGLAAALVAGCRLVGLAIVNAAFSVIPGTLALLRLRSLVPGLVIARARFDRTFARQLLAPSSAYWVLSLAAIFVFGIDSLVIAAYLGPEYVPRYAVPMQLIMGLQGVIAIFAAVAQPQISAAFALHDIRRLKLLHELLLGISLLAGGGAALVLWMTGETLIPMWAGSGIFPGDAAFFFMLVFFVVQASLGPADVLLQASAQHQRYAVMSVAEAILNVALSIWWIQLWGLTGVIAATVCARLATNAWYLHYKSSALLGVSAARAVGALVRLVVIPVAAAAAAAELVRFHAHAPVAAWTALPVALAVFVLLVGVTGRQTVSQLWRYARSTT
ncbi:MAG TPA: hypothetical protein VHP37_07025 [Burkholderiales bacterium]|nr:hypothetical protein [Burkholderiales bacterium]